MQLKKFHTKIRVGKKTIKICTTSVFYNTCDYQSYPPLGFVSWACVSRHHLTGRTFHTRSTGKYDPDSGAMVVHSVQYRAISTCPFTISRRAPNLSLSIVRLLLRDIARFGCLCPACVDGVQQTRAWNEFILCLLNAVQLLFHARFCIYHIVLLYIFQIKTLIWSDMIKFLLQLNHVRQTFMKC